MLFEYREIKERELVPVCVSMHKKMFNLSDEDAFPTLFFSLLIRQEHPMGIIIGCFKNSDNNDQELIGIVVTMVDVDNSLYCLFMCILPEYQNGRHGYNIINKFREVALSKGFLKLYGIYNPLEANLGKLYSYVGVKTNRYICKPYDIHEMTDSVDKVLFEWCLDSKSVESVSFQDTIKKYPVIQNLDMCESQFLLEIPNNYVELKKMNSNEINKQVEFIKLVLMEYLNNRGYYITDCLSGKYDGTKKTYYLLTK